MINMYIGPTVSTLVAPLVPTESFSTPMANTLVPSPTLALLATTLLAALALTKHSRSRAQSSIEDL